MVLKTHLKDDENHDFHKMAKRIDTESYSKFNKESIWSLMRIKGWIFLHNKNNGLEN